MKYEERIRRFTECKGLEFVREGRNFRVYRYPKDKSEFQFSKVVDYDLLVEQFLEWNAARVLRKIAGE